MCVCCVCACACVLVRVRACVRVQARMDEYHPLELEHEFLISFHKWKEDGSQDDVIADINAMRKKWLA